MCTYLVGHLTDRHKLWFHESRSIINSFHNKYSKTFNNRPDNLCTVDRSLAPDWFYHRTNTFQTSKKRTPLNSKQRTLMSPRHTLPNTKLPPKVDSETTPTNSFVYNATLVDHFRKIVRHRCWIQQPGITLALLLTVLAFIAEMVRSKNVTSHIYCAHQKYTEYP